MSKYFYRFLYIIMIFLWIMNGMESSATEIQLKDGRQLSGREGMLPALGELASVRNPQGDIRPLEIVFLDDDLHRTYFARKQVVKVNDNSAPVVLEKFTLDQPVKDTGSVVKSLGYITETQPFDSHGRRIITMTSMKGPQKIAQGITELTPVWTRIKGLTHIWDMRMATSSIPASQLSSILHQHALRICKGDKLEAILKITRFYLQAERYEDAAREVQAFIKSQPADSPEIKQVMPTLKVIRQLAAQRLLRELKMRRDNAQHALVYSKLQTFPTEGVAGEILQEVRELIAEYSDMEERRKKCVDFLEKAHFSMEDTLSQNKLTPVVQEIISELNANTLPRMEAYEAVADDKDTTENEKLALIITGWLLGARSATEKMVVAVSCVEVRDLIIRYIESGSTLARDAVIQRFRSQEAANVVTVSALLSHMKPPVRISEEMWQKKDGFFKVTFKSPVNELPLTYWVQLPLEYDPHRLYPAVLCLNGRINSAEQELDWWAGGWTRNKFRMGQAGRHGYIVIAPEWMESDQREYHYSAKEHAIILNILRDAFQRFSVDTDRVFLSGRSLGGDAAWDIGMAHPDVWAGLILFTCEGKKYCEHYWMNAKNLPIYYICGEYDNNILMKNKDLLTRMLTKGYDITVVEYLGRGHESFSDEILRLFDWMDRKRRDFYPAKFSVGTMRPWDNFFWWIELQGLPERCCVLPEQWPKRGASSAKMEMEYSREANSIRVKIPSKTVRIWAGPKMLNFERKIMILVNGKNVISSDVNMKPDLTTLLEDVRTRADRQNPFWAKLDVLVGRAK